jgi:hypothetical protein
MPALVLLVILAAAAAMLRGQLSPPPQSENVPDPPGAWPVERLPRVIAPAKAWREIPLPAGFDTGTQPAADLMRQVSLAHGDDGAWRILLTPARTAAEPPVTTAAEPPVTTVAELPAGAVRTRLVDRYLVVQREVRPGVTELSTLDLATGVRRTAPDQLLPDPMAATASVIAVAANEQCLLVFELASLSRLASHCADPGWSISLLTAEADGPQWRQTAVGQPCARWFGLDQAGVSRPLPTGEAACRAAVLLRVDGWELTADFPPYEVGVAHPGPLMARGHDRWLTLDASVLELQLCGRHVYWLSQPDISGQRGALARWAPGAERIEVIPFGEERLAAPPRCVNGVLNALTTASDTTRLWILPNP